MKTIPEKFEAFENWLATQHKFVWSFIFAVIVSVGIAVLIGIFVLSHALHPLGPLVLLAFFMIWAMIASTVDIVE